MPLLLKERSIISIIILSDFPTVLLLTVLLLGHLVQLAARKSRLLSPERRLMQGLTGQLFSWESFSCEPASADTALPAASSPVFRLTLASEGDVGSIVTWEKPWEAPAPKRLRVAGGSRRSQAPCSCQGDTGHIGRQPGQTWQLQQCVPGVSMG